ncbi:MAG: EamA family transporter RarD [Alphaproteobacteria bacterium]|nr:EamA family transporter RarD [Alphaproteobacteria bacterium]
MADRATDQPSGSSPSVTNTQDASASAVTGVLYALAAFGTWGILTPIYFKIVDAVSVEEILAQRIVWSVVVLAIIAGVFGQLSAVRKALSNPRALLYLAGSTSFITLNWGVYIYAIQANQATEASLGYYITPLVNASLGVLVLKEKLSVWKGGALGLAATGVAVLFVGEATIAWVTVILAFSFAIYGLLRKMAPVAALPGLLIETLIVSPFALAYLIYLGGKGTLAFGATGWQMDVLIAASGLVTALPLLWFNECAKRLTMVTVGFFQYLTPTLLFLVAVFVFDEPFNEVRLITFLMIWGALALYSRELLRGRLRRR